MEGEEEGAEGKREKGVNTIFSPVHILTTPFDVVFFQPVLLFQSGSTSAAPYFSFYSRLNILSITVSS